MSIFSELFRPFIQENIQEVREQAKDSSRMVSILEADNERLQERLAELEVSLEQEGWSHYEANTSRELSRSGLQKMVRLARLMYISNPLINMGITVQCSYVWGQGINVTASNDKVNEVVQNFWKNRANRVEFTSSQAQQYKEAELAVAGNIFVVFFTTGKGLVKLRSIPFEEVTDIISNPQDMKDVWYYRREATVFYFDTNNGVQTPRVEISYYPDWLYRPPEDERPEKIGSWPVYWDQPVYHIKVGGMDKMRFGIPEVYPALDWARAVQQDMQAYASIHQALSRFAWQMIVPNAPNAVQAAKTRLQTTAGPSNPDERNPSPAIASTFVNTADVQLRPMQTRNVAPDPEEGRRLWLMVANGLNLPETFLSDASVGNFATAKTLDRPTELRFVSRRSLWQDVIKDILDYQIDVAALSPSNIISGEEIEDDDGEITIRIFDPETNEDFNRQVNVSFPSLLERSVVERVGAIVNAATLGGHPDAGTMTPQLLARLLYNELDMDDTDKELEAYVAWLANQQQLVAPDTDPDQLNIDPTLSPTDTQDWPQATLPPPQRLPPAMPPAQRESLRVALQQLKEALATIARGEE